MEYHWQETEKEIYVASEIQQNIGNINSFFYISPTQVPMEQNTWQTVKIPYKSERIQVAWEFTILQRGKKWGFINQWKLYNQI